MKIIRSIITALALYSRIPMPKVKWDEDGTKHAIDFLPLVGLIIGGLSFIIIKAASAYDLPPLFVTLMLTVLPLLITGGFHVDGFMDVSDAVHSWQPKEKKLLIMKDPHIGAFAVISAGTALLIWIGFLYHLVFMSFEHEKLFLLEVYCLIFVLVRAACALSCIVFPGAKDDGMLSMETKDSRRGDIIFLLIQALAAAGLMMKSNLYAGILSGGAIIIFFLWHHFFCKKHFGGGTGDTAGFSVVTGEILLVVVLDITGFFVL